MKPPPSFLATPLDTSLGLAICRQIIEAHHGTLSAGNLLGGGCEFKMTLLCPL